MKSERRIVFLYTELAGYILRCFERLSHVGVDVHVVAYPVNVEAPFQFNFAASKCKFYDRSEHTFKTLEALIRAVDPQAMVVSGWIDSTYVKLARTFKPSFRQTVLIDNPYASNMKTNLSILRARLLFKKAFHSAWVPGMPQVKFAKIMGFDPDKIYDGFYTADVVHLSAINWESAEADFPKRFVFTGRYVDFKGIRELWEAFAKVDRCGWELYCAGTGPLYEDRSFAEGIHHVGFVQPVDFGTFAQQGGVFILPSRREPWGVVVHEFAAVGYPLLCSAAVGSASAFLEEGENGFTFKPNSVNSIRSVLERIIATPSEDLWEMGAKSRKLAAQVTVNDWVETALELLKPRYA